MDDSAQPGAAEATHESPLIPDVDAAAPAVRLVEPPKEAPRVSAQDALNAMRAKRAANALPPTPPPRKMKPQGPGKGWPKGKKRGPQTNRPESAAERARRERAERLEANPETPDAPPPGVPAQPEAKRAESQKERWMRERVRIGNERNTWSHLLNGTVVPLVSMVTRMSTGVELAEYTVDVPVIKEDGEYGKVVTTMDAAISVTLGQALACGYDANIAMERPYAIPILSVLVLATQIAGIVAMRKLGASPRDIAEATARMKAAGEKIDHQPTPAPNHQ